MQYRPSFQIIGISLRTTNENGQAGRDIPQLWQRFFAENILEKIPNKSGTTIYSVYTDYEKDYTRPYTVILGCRVTDSQTIPEGMVAKTIPEGNFAQFIAQGHPSSNPVFNEWVKIWNANLDRDYSADYEVYSEKAHNPENAEVDIFIAIK